MELLLDLIFDGIFAAFDSVIDGWFALMQWIVPEKTLGKTARTIIKIVVGIFSLLLLVCMVLGIVALLSEDAYTRQVGKYMVFIPLGISILQIVLGIVVRVVGKKNK